MKKLLFLISTLDGGGAEKVLVDLVNKLNRDKYEITIVTLLSGGIFENKLNENINHSSIINFNNKFIRKVLFYIISFILPDKIANRIIVRKKYDIEVAYLEGVPTKIIAASRDEYSKKFAFVHSDVSNNYSLNKIYKTFDDCLKSYKLFDKVFFVSNNAKEGFEDTIGKLSIGSVLHNVLDYKTIINLSKKEIPEIKPDKFLFVSVGRLSKQKGYDRLIESASRLNKDDYNYEIWIIGEGEERENLEDLLEKYNIKNFKLLGFKKNPYAYISNSDMFICSSRVEGYSTVVTESLILKTPILTTNCAGMDELLENGKYGKIVENNTEGIYIGMKEILDSKNEYNKYLALAKERSDYFIMDKNIQIYEEIFDEVNDSSVL